MSFGTGCRGASRVSDRNALRLTEQEDITLACTAPPFMAAWGTGHHRTQHCSTISARRTPSRHRQQASRRASGATSSAPQPALHAKHRSPTHKHQQLHKPAGGSTAVQQGQVTTRLANKHKDEGATSPDVSIACPRSMMEMPHLQRPQSLLEWGLGPGGVRGGGRRARGRRALQLGRHCRGRCRPRSMRVQPLGTYTHGTSASHLN